MGCRDAYPILIKGLHRLEYRGYDSAGVALIGDSASLNIFKAVGKVSKLEEAAEGKDRSGSIGIAHTRWAPASVTPIHIFPRAENSPWSTTALSRMPVTYASS